MAILAMFFFFFFFFFCTGKMPMLRFLRHSWAGCPCYVSSGMT
jgi:hypothetical protein